MDNYSEYSTSEALAEKFAGIAMCNYFEIIGLLAEFIEDEPCIEDM